MISDCHTERNESMKLKTLALVCAVLLVGGLSFAAVTRRHNYSARPEAQQPGAAHNQAPGNPEMIGVGARDFRSGANPDGNPDPNPSSTAPAQQSASPSAAGDPATEVIRLANAERSQIGLPALAENTKLSGVASTKASDMATHNYFSHTSPTYGSPFDMMRSSGIAYTAAGENIAKGQTSPQQVMSSWMNSPGHRQNILDARFTQIGVGFDSRGNYWVQQFIKP
jgi:uncharacterized YkwD family protein